jgi:hypothetical protein
MCWEQLLRSAVDLPTPQGALIDLQNRDTPWYSQASWVGVTHDQPRESEFKRLGGQTIFENHILFGMRSPDSGFFQARIVDLNDDHSGSVHTLEGPESM